jgi:hypothetical protein
MQTVVQGNDSPALECWTCVFAYMIEGEIVENVHPIIFLLNRSIDFTMTRYFDFNKIDTLLMLTLQLLGMGSFEF